MSINISHIKWSKTQAPPSAAPQWGGRIGLLFLIILYHKYLWMFLIYSLYVPHIYNYIYTFPEYVPYISLVCFLIYGVKSRSGHDRSQSFGSVSHVPGPKLTFWGNFQMILHGVVLRSSNNKVVPSKNVVWRVKTMIF